MRKVGLVPFSIWGNCELNEMHAPGAYDVPATSGDTCEPDESPRDARNGLHREIAARFSKSPTNLSAAVSSRRLLLVWSPLDVRARQSALQSACLHGDKSGCGQPCTSHRLMLGPSTARGRPRRRPSSADPPRRRRRLAQWPPRRGSGRTYVTRFNFLNCASASRRRSRRR